MNSSPYWPEWALAVELIPQPDQAPIRSCEDFLVLNPYWNRKKRTLLNLRTRILIPILDLNQMLKNEPLHKVTEAPAAMGS